jgi:BirA family biotin operon repressor/biotin-[acetyl-CoA-carboxylase] ligase
MIAPKPATEWFLPTRHVGRRVLYYDQLPSVLTVAAGFAAEPGTAILAGEQTAGRGQYGRSWHCPAGAGVLLAIVLTPPPPLRGPAMLTAWAAVGVAECVQRLTGLAPTIKWPNDVLIDGKKVSGILIESSAAGRAPTAVAGIGLNVTQSAESFAAAGLPEATSLAASTGRAFDTLDVARALLVELDRVYGLVLDGEMAAMEAAWVRRLGLLGKEVIAEIADGSLRRGHLRILSFDRMEITTEHDTTVRLLPEEVRHLMPADKDHVRFGSGPPPQ